MKQRTRKLLALLLVLVMAVSAAVPAFAAENLLEGAVAYEGDAVNFINADGGQFGMFTPLEGTTCVLNGRNVVIHYVPKNTTVYGALHYGPITDELTEDVTFNEDGSFDISLPRSVCGWAILVAPIKKSDAAATTSSQYYLAIPAEDKLEDETPVVEPIPYEGDAVNFINADGGQFGMFTPQEGTTCVINGKNVVIHYVPKNTTVYGGLHYGPITDELTPDVTFNDDGSFDISISKSNCGWAIPVAPIKKSDADATTSSQYYLAIPAEDKLEDVTSDPEPQPEPEPQPQPGDGERVDLEVINTTGMFKGLYAYLTEADGQSALVVALTGSSYRYLIPGTYAQAVAAGEDRSGWIAGQQDADGKWFFTLPLDEGQTYLPVISVSQTYLDKYEKGENPLERAYYPRQMTLDPEAKTLTIGDYDETLTVTVTSTVEGFSPAGTAQMRVVGGPNSNNFRVAPVLQMADDAWDLIVYPTVADGALTTAEAALSADNTFTLDIGNAPTVYAFRDKEPFAVQLRLKATGEIVDASVTVDLLALTLVIDGAAEEVSYVFSAGADGSWTQGSAQDFTMTVKRTAGDETTFSRFTGVTVDGKALSASDYEASAGSLVLTLKADYLKTLAAGKHEITVTFEDGSVSTSLTVREAGVPAPDTGVPGVGLWLVLACLAAAGLAFLPVRRRET